MEKRVVITGGNRGIGLEFARQYLMDGWQVVATTRSLDYAQALRALEAVSKGVEWPVSM